MVNGLVTVEGLMGGIYDLCGNPPEDKLSPSQVLNVLYDKIQHYSNRMKLTNEPWQLDYAVITANPNQEDYILEVPNFGRPFFVETWEPNQPYFRRREVYIVRPQDRDLYTPTSRSDSGSIKHSAVCFIFRNLGEQINNFQILPVPRQQASYRIWYERTFIVADNEALDSPPQFMWQFFPLLKEATLLDVIVIPGVWLGMPEMLDRFISTHQGTLARYEDTFENYIAEAYHPQETTIQAVCSSRMGRRRR